MSETEYLSLSDLFHEAKYPLGPSTLLQMAEFYPFYGWVIFYYIYKCVYINMYIHVCVTSSFIHSSIDGHLGCFHALTIVHNAAINTGVRLSFQINVFVFLGCMSSSRIARSYDSSIFSFLRNLHTVSHSWLHQFTFPPTV